jgi:hypothetical protein
LPRPFPVARRRCYRTFRRLALLLVANQRQQAHRPRRKLQLPQATSQRQQALSRKLPQMSNPRWRLAHCFRRKHLLIFRLRQSFWAWCREQRQRLNLTTPRTRRRWRAL